MAKTWTPNASYTAYGDDYYQQGNKYGDGMKIAGSSAAPDKPKAPGQLEDMNVKDMNRNQRERWRDYQQSMQQYNRQNKRYQGTNNYLANQIPYEHFSNVMSQAGYTPGGSSPFEQWLKNEFTNIQQGYDSATFANNQLNFADYLRTFGAPKDFGNFLLTRFQSRTPGQQGMQGTTAFGGPARWSVF